MQKQDLINALEIVRPGLASKEMITQTTSFAFIEGKVVTFNDEISVSHPIDLGIEGAIKADELYKLLSKMEDDKIELITKGSELLIKAKRAKAGLTIQETELPLNEVGEIGKWRSLPKEIMSAIGVAMYTCSKDTSQTKFTAIHVSNKGKVESTDRNRITQCDVPKIKMPSFLIPATTARELVKYNVTKVADGNSWMHFKTQDDTVFSCRVFDDTFPNLNLHLKIEGPTIKLPTAVSDILERASIFSKRDHFLHESVLIHIENGEMTVRAEGDSGWFEETARIRYKQDPVSFSVNPAFLKEIASKTPTCIIGKKAILFEADTWKHAVGLVEM